LAGAIDGRHYMVHGAVSAVEHGDGRILGNRTSAYFVQKWGTRMGNVISLPFLASGIGFPFRIPYYMRQTLKPMPGETVDCWSIFGGDGGMISWMIEGNNGLYRFSK